MESFNINDTKDLTYKDYRGEYFKYRDIHGNEFSMFFKDDWKIRPSLTLNLGLRYEWYGVPWETKGLIVAPVGGANGLFGYSGKSFADWLQPGKRGDLTTFSTEMQKVGEILAQLQALTGSTASTPKTTPSPSPSASP